MFSWTFPCHESELSISRLIREFIHEFCKSEVSRVNPIPQPACMPHPMPYYVLQLCIHILVFKVSDDYGCSSGIISCTDEKNGCNASCKLIFLSDWYVYVQYRTLITWAENPIHRDQFLRPFPPKNFLKQRSALLSCAARPWLWLSHNQGRPRGCTWYCIRYLAMIWY
jgi:hypothetical protein